jgi:hypothetical protein
MGAFIDRVKSAQSPLLWLDYEHYAAGLLAAGVAPWPDTAACVAWMRKAQSLLRSDVIMLPVASVCAAWLAGNEPLRSAMAAKRRTVFALKTLLSDEPLRAHLLDLAQALRLTFAGQPMALCCPSPQAWIVDAHRAAHGADAEVEPDADDIDSATLYLADFLRVFGNVNLDLLLLQEAPAAMAVDGATIDAYRGALNVAANYRWDAGLKLPTAGGTGLPSDLAFVVGTQPVDGSISGVELPEAFWSESTPLTVAGGAFRYAAIPAGADPERVLQRLALLR